jgi:hypothetical protein
LVDTDGIPRKVIGCAAGGNDDVLGLDLFLSALKQIDVDFALGSESTPSLEVVNVVILK